MSHRGHRVPERVDRACLLELWRVQQDDLPVDVGDGDPLDDGESAGDQTLLHLIDDLGDVEDDLVPLHRHGSRLFTLRTRTRAV
jgi:hypothetical protein